MNRLSLVLILFCLNNIAFSQDCRVSHFNNIHLLTDYPYLDSLANIVKNDSTDNYHLILIRHHGEVNKYVFYHITIDSSGIVKFTYKDGSIKVPLKYSNNLIAFRDLEAIDKLGRVEGICHTAGVNHETTRLFFSRRGAFFLSVLASDGNMKELLRTEKDLATIDPIYRKLVSLLHM